jgi:hypothetical protein
MRPLTDLSVSEGHGMRHGRNEHHGQQSRTKSQLKQLHDMRYRLRKGLKLADVVTLGLLTSPPTGRSSWPQHGEADIIWSKRCKLGDHMGLELYCTVRAFSNQNTVKYTQAARFLQGNQPPQSENPVLPITAQRSVGFRPFPPNSLPSTIHQLPHPPPIPSHSPITPFSFYVKQMAIMLDWLFV